MKPKNCESCDLYRTGKGFVLDWGDPENAKVMLQLEAPGTSELVYRVDLVDRAELGRRATLYDLPRDVMKTGAALVGKSWYLLESWVLRDVGLQRSDLYISNTIRCLFSPRAGVLYPTGKARKSAEQECRQYDLIDLFRPDLFFIAPHPAAIFRDLAFLPVLRNVFRKVRDCVDLGLRPCVLMGEKAAAQRLGTKLSSVRKLHGHYEWVR